MLSSLIKSNFIQKKLFQSLIEKAFHFHYGALLDVAKQNPEQKNSPMNFIFHQNFQKKQTPSNLNTFPLPFFEIIKR